MLQVSQLIGFGVGQPDASSVFTDSMVSGSDTVPYTFTNRAIGVAAPGRRIVVGVGLHNGTGAAISSLTIGGVPATQLVTVQHPSSWGMAAIFILQVDAGTTATIVINCSAANRVGVSVWAVYDLLSETPTDTGTSTADPETDTLNIAAGGVALGIATVESNTGVTYSWTGLTERFDSAMELNDRASGASLDFAAAQTALSITADPSSSFYSAAMALVSLR